MSPPRVSKELCHSACFSRRLPKVPFLSFAHVMPADPTAGQPGTAFGRIGERAGRWVLPVGVQVNHMFIDGADLGDLYEAAQASFDSPG